MSAGWVRGACPSLSAPMLTGDGLLVRMTPRGGALTVAQLAGIAEAADAFGNGAIEITARGSLQIRGLTDRTVDLFGHAIETLGIAAEGAPEIRTGALAGRDASEIADPRPLATGLRSAIDANGPGARFAPKVSIVVDGGGALPLSSVAADIRLEAMRVDGERPWRVCVGRGGTEFLPIGQGRTDEAIAATIALLELLAKAGSSARARDLDAAASSTIAAMLAPVIETGRAVPASPVGTFALTDETLARGFALPFGQIEAASLRAFVQALDPGFELRLAPSRGLLVLGLSQVQSERVGTVADTNGLVVDAGDLRLKIAACAGAPACASAHLPTKAIAQSVVESRPDLLASLPALHISGCGKQCARPAGSSLSLIGTAAGPELLEDGVRTGDEIRADLLALARGPVETRRRRHA
jgi:precorrin-3B synthase